MKNPNHEPLVLIADDDERFRETFRDALESRGHRVVTAAGPDEALRLALDAPVGVALLDNRFPNDGDGLALLARIKERRPEVEALVITSYGDDAGNHEAVCAGVYAYLPKTGDIALLRSTVGRCLEKIELKRRNAELAAQVVARNAELETLVLSLRQWNESLVERVRSHERRLGLDDASGGLPLDEESRFVVSSFLHEIENRMTILSPDYIELMFRDRPASAREIDALANLFSHVQGLTKDFRLLMARDRAERCVIPAWKIEMRAWSAVRPLAEAAGVEMRGIVERRSGDGVNCNPHQLVCALFNLLKNAVEASAPLPEESNRFIELENRLADGAVVWTVRDGGPELPADTRARLFEKYFTTKPRGTGIGLALTRRITEAHGGAIEFLREGGRNAFRITLPLEPEAAAAPAGAPGGADVRMA